MQETGVVYKVLTGVALMLILSIVGYLVGIKTVYLPPPGPGPGWSCKPSSGPCNSLYEGRQGCNGSMSNVCTTQNGNCMCIPL